MWATWWEVSARSIPMVMMLVGPSYMTLSKIPKIASGAVVMGGYHGAQNFLNFQKLEV